jgi:hypothetical protein
MFKDKNWELYECDEVGLRFVKPTNAYEVELAALKRKHGRA